MAELIVTTPDPAGEVAQVRRFRLVAGEGPSAGQAWSSAGDRLAIGSHPSNDVVLDDDTVSRFHCEIRIEQGAALVRDLESRNGTVLDGVRVNEGFLRNGSVIRLGKTALQFQLTSEHQKAPVSGHTEFGSLVGSSFAMRTAFGLLERVAATSTTVLLEGETGTGKEEAAESLHRASPRSGKPLVVVDCAAIPANLLESQLFGHEKGSFTDASAQRIGAFEEAEGGTIFLDEVGELPLELQPKLLRVLEKREIRRLGSNAVIPVDVRVVAATHRDLRAAVNAGRFRSDLYFRLAVVRVQIPPLRSRPEDLPLLVERILARLGATPEARERLRDPAFLRDLACATWPGNVRELRNYLERSLVLDQTPPMADGSTSAVLDQPLDASRPYADARRSALDQFEYKYLRELLQLHAGNVSAAAEAAGMNRVYLYRILRRHGLRPR
jgi:DNA-binding NtrC family response regulator